MDTGVGRRIAYWRELRGLTQADFGRLMGQSRRWVQDLEGGQRQSDPRLSVLARAAEVLRIPLERLVADTANSRPAAALPPAVAALADSLHAPASGTVVRIAELRRRVEYCYQAWASAHYVAAARDLPGVIADARSTADESPEGGLLLSRAYQLAASLLFKFGAVAHVPGVLAADRALAAASACGDPVMIGSAARRVARGLIHQQRHTAAAEYATATANTLRPELEQAGTAGLSTLGMLYLVAAVGFSNNDRSPQTVAIAEERLAEAGEVAERQGPVRTDVTGFGATNVALHEVDVLLRLDDAWSAVEAAQRIAPEAVKPLSKERQARHLVTTARAHALTRNREAAVRDLLEAERLAPEEVRRPAVASFVGELVELVPSPGPELTGLARRCGVMA
ncbi:helix-turn-helix domain-containing protein [Streptomyces nanshensis]|nr:helix-turn-helix transcriptional regulator [Streptomyces nanshensis]